MKHKLVIVIEEDFEIAKQILNKWQYIIYKKSARGLASIIYRSCKNFQCKEEKNKKIFEEVGGLDYIKEQKAKLENFLFSDEKELKKDAYKQYRDKLNDRFLQKVRRKAGHFTKRIKNKALKSAMMGSDVLSFFSRIGLIVTWKIEKYKKDNANED